MKPAQLVPKDDGKLFASLRTMFGQAVDAVESRMIVDRQVTQSDGLKKIICLANFADTCTIYSPVHGTNVVATKQDTNATGGIGKIVLAGFVGSQPVRDLGVKFRSRIGAIHDCFHMANSIAVRGVASLAGLPHELHGMQRRRGRLPNCICTAKKDY